MTSISTLGLPKRPGNKPPISAAPEAWMPNTESVNVASSAYNAAIRSGSPELHALV